MAEKLLFVNSCIKSKDESRTEKMCRSFLDEFKKYHGNIEIEEIKLENAGLQSMTRDKIEDRFKFSQQRDFTDPMFDMANHLVNADYVLIGAPFWDLSFPSYLKIWVENIMVTNLTFQYTEQGIQGMCHAKKMIYITSAGGTIGADDFGYKYMSAIANTIGIESVKCIKAEGLDVWGNDPEKIVEAALREAFSDNDLF